jgi:tRNA(Arg) A34 adenosine deaminase TadA
MEWVLGLARRNIEEATGGPFAAAVFDLRDGALISAGVNVVEPSQLSSAHAEVMALSLAQHSLSAYDLSRLPLQLVSSAEPCSMCLGAIHWAGFRSVAYAATDADVRTIGFDEGHKPSDWQAALAQRGIEVLREVLRPEGQAVLALYRAHQGQIYNAGA